jgi:hypothetical protein
MVDDGQWVCVMTGEILTKEAQRLGCGTYKKSEMFND